MNDRQLYCNHEEYSGALIKWAVEVMNDHEIVCQYYDHGFHTIWSVEAAIYKYGFAIWWAGIYKMRDTGLIGFDCDNINYE